MNVVLLLFIGFISGVIGGMGMGGGTILIPLLTIFGNINQHVSQSANLISFIPMSFIAILFHIKNNYVKFDNFIFISLSGIVSSMIGSMISVNIKSEILSKIFGGFLIILAIFIALNFIKKKKSKKN